MIGKTIRWGDLRWLGVKLKRRLAEPSRRRNIREQDRVCGAPNPFEESWSPLPWDSLAAVPGNLPAHADLPIETTSGHDVRQKDASYAILSDRVRSFAITDESRKTLIRRLAPDVPDALIDAYTPIDWHIDVHSGYRWDSDEFYLDVRVAPVSGADIKTPRELSRFQHVPLFGVERTAADGIEFLLQMVDWIAANPLRRGVNWACTMDVALRLVSWIWGLRCYERVLQEYPRSLRCIGASISQHVEHIAANLEYYPESTSNHYLADIAGLLYGAACFPQLRDSDRWLLFALQELSSEMQREVYADGACHESSTHYHRLVAELFASCAALAERIPNSRRERLLHVDRRGHTVEPVLRDARSSGLNLTSTDRLLSSVFYDKLAAMADFTMALTKSNGRVPQFGDNDSARAHKLTPSAQGEVRDHRHLVALIDEVVGRPRRVNDSAEAIYEARLVGGGLRVAARSQPNKLNWADDRVHFSNAGVAVMREGSAFVAITCGPNGQSGRGGHGHNDKNSFELSIGGLDFIVDGGCPAYTSAPEVRNSFRATGAHSTVSSDLREQDAWIPGVDGLFLLREKSNPKLVLAGDGTVVGRHKGFGAVHTRSFALTRGQLAIEDRCACDGVRRINFNLDPAVSVSELNANDGVFRCIFVHRGGRIVRLTIVGVAAPELGPGRFSVGYGKPVENSRLSVCMLSESARTELSWDE